MVPIRPGSKPHAANNSLGPLGHYYMELVSARGGISPLGLESLWGNPEFLKNSKKIYIYTVEDELFGIKIDLFVLSSY